MTHPSPDRVAGAAVVYGVRIDPWGRIDQDLPCAVCGYNLRTLSAAAACPECGRRVEESLARRRGVEEGRKAVKAPAIALIVAASVPLLFTAYELAGAMLAWAESPRGSGASGSSLWFLSLPWLPQPLAAGFIVWGGARMLQRRNYHGAIAVAVLSIMPGFSPCCVLGMPFGIWALSVLMRPEVQAAFEAERRNAAR